MPHDTSKVSKGIAIFALWFYPKFHPPPQSLHCDLPLMCSQIPPTQQSLQLDFILLCPQAWLLPHSLHFDPCLLCSQIWLLPQSFQYGLCLLCLHLVCCPDFSKHFTQHFVNCPVRGLTMNSLTNKKKLHFIHCFFSIFINHQAYEKYHFLTKNKMENPALLVRKTFHWLMKHRLFYPMPQK